MTDLTLFLLFKIGEDRFALNCEQVTEVLPLLAFKQLPKAQAGIAGLFDYRGIPTPIVDINEVTLGRPARARVSTRIIIVNFIDADGNPHPLGVIAEQVTQTLRCSVKNFMESNVETPETPFLGLVMTDTKGIIQWVDVQKLIPENISVALFQTAARAG